MHRTILDVHPESIFSILNARRREKLKLHGDWSAIDDSRTLALLETEAPGLLEQIQSPFRPFADMEPLPVASVSGWQKAG